MTGLRKLPPQNQTMSSRSDIICITIKKRKNKIKRNSLNDLEHHSAGIQLKIDCIYKQVGLIGELHSDELRNMAPPQYF